MMYKSTVECSIEFPEPFYYESGRVIQATFEKMDRFVTNEDTKAVGFGTTKEQAREQLFITIQRKAEEKVKIVIRNKLDEPVPVVSIYFEGTDKTYEYPA